MRSEDKVRSLDAQSIDRSVGAMLEGINNFRAGDQRGVILLPEID